jgi:protein-disulfide isomerase
MHDLIFANQRTMQVPTLKEHAATLKLDSAKFGECLDSSKFAAVIAEDLQFGEQIGVQSTPTMYINGRPIVGAQPYDAFQAVIDEELARAK